MENCARPQCCSLTQFPPASEPNSASTAAVRQRIFWSTAAAACLQWAKMLWSVSCSPSPLMSQQCFVATKQTVTHQDVQNHTGVIFIFTSLVQTQPVVARPAPGQQMLPRQPHVSERQLKMRSRQDTIRIHQVWCTVQKQTEEVQMEQGHEISRSSQYQCISPCRNEKQKLETARLSQSLCQAAASLRLPMKHTIGLYHHHISASGKALLCSARDQEWDIQQDAWAGLTMYA